MQNTLFYIVEQFKKPTDNLLEIVKNHSFIKYGEKCETSVFTYQTLFKGLKKVFKVDGFDIDFLESGKPVMDGFSVSLSHTDGLVAVAFTKGDLPVGIDLEVVGNKKSERLSGLLGLDSTASIAEQYLAFTKRESVIKAHNLTMLTRQNLEFKGESKIVEYNGVKYALSIYFDGVIKEIKL